jgi:ribonuclease J
VSVVLQGATKREGVRIFAMGGLGEVGMNCLAIEQDGHVLLVDCGVTFDFRGLGIDVIHPDFSAMDAYRDRILGIFVTHGHEDHIGAIPYFLARFDVPIWGPKYALALIRNKLAEFEILEHATMIETDVREKYEIGPFSVEPIRVTHSIADATALAIRTSAGMVIHTGDFKIDEQPTDGEAFDHSRFRELGDEGVALLMSDSTNVDSEGRAGDERSVEEKLDSIVANAKGAVVVAVFASNVHRLRLLGEIALRRGRKIVPLGRSISTHSEIAHATGYLDWPSDLTWSVEKSNELLHEKILGIATGTQAETRAALSRLSRGDHPHFSIGQGDVVAFSSRIIPGNEPEVYKMMSDLIRRGVDVRSRATDRDIHVSGHACRAEQRTMIQLTRPRAFIPLHGTLHHLTRHAQLAREAGVEHVVAIENGEVAELTRDGKIEKVGTVTSGRVHTSNGKEVAPQVIRDRRALAESGVATVLVKIDSDVTVKIESRGVVDAATQGPIVKLAENSARGTILELLKKETTAADIALETRLAVRRIFSKSAGVKPVTLVTIVRKVPT